MNKHWKAHSFVVGSLLLIAPGIMVAREPKLQNPCKDLRIDLDNQVNSLHNANRMMNWPSAARQTAKMLLSVANSKLNNNSHCASCATSDNPSLAAAILV